MKVILKSSDISIIAFAEVLLKSEGIVYFVFDENISGIEGGINVFPKRLMVLKQDYLHARDILIDNSLEVL